MESAIRSQGRKYSTSSDCDRKGEKYAKIVYSGDDAAKIVVVRRFSFQVINRTRQHRGTMDKMAKQ